MLKVIVSLYSKTKVMVSPLLQNKGYGLHSPQNKEYMPIQFLYQTYMHVYVSIVLQTKGCLFYTSFDKAKCSIYTYFLITEQCSFHSPSKA